MMKHINITLLILLTIILYSGWIYAETTPHDLLYGKDISQYWSITPDDASKEADSIDIDVSDLKKEIDWLRDEIKTLKEEKVKSEMDYGYDGKMEFRSRLGNGGMEGNYRLVFSYERDLGVNTSFKMNLDTMDGGFNSLDLRDFATKLIDLEGRFIGDIGIERPILIKALFGPGDVIHRDTSSVAPSDDYRVYRRSYPTFSFAMELGGFNVDTSYIARNVDSGGKVNTSEVMVEFSKKVGTFNNMGDVEWFGKVKAVYVDIINPTAYEYDTFQGMGFKLRQSEMIYEEIFFDYGSSLSNSYYFNGKVAINGINEGNTDLIFEVYNIGSAYRKAFISEVFMPINIFDKYVLNDSVDLGIGLTHRISSRASIIFKSDLTMKSNWTNDPTTAGTSLTNELGVNYYIMRDMVLAASYRNYNVPSGTGQFGNALPVASDLYSFSLIYMF